MTTTQAGVDRLTPFDIAVGWPHGHVTAPRAEVAPQREMAPLAALEAALLPALRRPPCFVTFSGGRDSSAVLAAAVGLARREGLDPPLPITRVFPNHHTADEAAWQERVVRHLGVGDDWTRLRFEHDELDLVGPTAVASLREHGLLFPAPVHGNVPIFAAAAGGSVLTGQGGDEVFGIRRTTPLRWLLRGGRSRRGAAAHLLETVGPAWSRRRVAQRARDGDPRRRWLRPDAAERFTRLVVEEAVTEPFDWLAATRRLFRRRAWLLGVGSMQRLADDCDVEVHHPLTDPGFIESLAPSAGRLGFRTRTDAMTEVFAELLPAEVLRRTSKARFNSVAVGEHSQRFLREWDGSSPSELVDPTALRHEWRKDEPHAGTFLLLQAAWRLSVGGG